jgi:hypothetical protein
MKKDLSTAIDERGTSAPSGEPKRVTDANYTEKWSVALAGKEVIFAENENDRDDVPYLVCVIGGVDASGVRESAEDETYVDYLDAVRGFVDRVDDLLCSLERERAAFMTVQPTLTAADCLPGGLDENLTGKVVVIKPDVLSPEYRFADHQLKIVRGGFGATSDVRGNAVFCKDLYYGRESRFERDDIAGVIDPARMPKWAEDMLAYNELSRYAEPPQKRTAARGGVREAAWRDIKPSLLDRLNANKEKVSRVEAEQDKPATKDKKRDEREV